MDKEKELLTSLEKINVGKQDIMKRLVEEQISNRLKVQGWDKTFEYVKEMKAKYPSDGSVLGNRLNHLYSQAYAKMWSLNKK